MPNCFARPVAQGDGATPSRATTAASDPSPPAFVEVDPDSLELTQPRSIGVEHVALAAMRELAFDPLLESLGINGVMRTAIVDTAGHPGFGVRPAAQIGNCRRNAVRLIYAPVAHLPSSHRRRPVSSAALH